MLKKMLKGFEMSIPPQASPPAQDSMWPAAYLPRPPPFREASQGCKGRVKKVHCKMCSETVEIHALPACQEKVSSVQEHGEMQSVKKR